MNYYRKNFFYKLRFLSWITIFVFSVSGTGLSFPEQSTRLSVKLQKATLSPDPTIAAVSAVSVETAKRAGSDAASPSFLHNLFTPGRLLGANKFRELESGAGESTAGSEMDMLAQALYRQRKGLPEEELVARDYNAIESALSRGYTPWFQEGRRNAGGSAPLKVMIVDIGDRKRFPAHAGEIENTVGSLAMAWLPYYRTGHSKDKQPQEIRLYIPKKSYEDEFQDGTLFQRRAFLQSLSHELEEIVNGLPNWQAALAEREYGVIDSEDVLLGTPELRAVLNQVDKVIQKEIMDHVKMFPPTYRQLRDIQEAIESKDYLYLLHLLRDYGKVTEEEGKFKERFKEESRRAFLKARTIGRTLSLLAEGAFLLAKEKAVAEDREKIYKKELLEAFYKIENPRLITEQDFLSGIFEDIIQKMQWSPLLLLRSLTVYFKDRDFSFEDVVGQWQIGQQRKGRHLRGWGSWEERFQEELDFLAILGLLDVTSDGAQRYSLTSGLKGLELHRFDLLQRDLEKIKTSKGAKALTRRGIPEGDFYDVFFQVQKVVALYSGRPQIISSVPPLETRTKIISTLGPRTDSDPIIEELIDLGVGTFRFNFSHIQSGNYLEVRRWMQRLRKMEAKKRRPITAVADLQGPKLRTSVLSKKYRYVEEDKDGEYIPLTEGKTVSFMRADNPEIENLGNKKVIPMDYSADYDLADEIVEGRIIKIADGTIELEVTDVNPDTKEIQAIVKTKGESKVRSRKGLNAPGTKVTLSSLQEDDYKDLEFAVRAGFDAIALSFVQDVEDIRKAKRELKKIAARVAPHSAEERKRIENLVIISKIETKEALKPDIIAAILEETDVLMIARGDLFVEVGKGKGPVAQKRLIKLAREHQKPVILATGVAGGAVKDKITEGEEDALNSAVNNFVDMVMTSGETTEGRDPISTIESMRTIILEAEIEVAERRHEKRRDGIAPGRVGAEPLTDVIGKGIVRSSLYAAETMHTTYYYDEAGNPVYHTPSGELTYEEDGNTEGYTKIGAEAVVIHTQSGASGRVASIARSEIPLVFLTHSERTARGANFNYGARTVRFSHYPPNLNINIVRQYPDLLRDIFAKEMRIGHVMKKDKFHVYVTYGRPRVGATTNTNYGVDLYDLERKGWVSDQASGFYRPEGDSGLIEWIEGRRHDDDARLPEHQEGARTHRIFWPYLNGDYTVLNLVKPSGQSDFDADLEGRLQEMRRENPDQIVIVAVLEEGLSGADFRPGSGNRQPIHTLNSWQGQSEVLDHETGLSRLTITIRNLPEGALPGISYQIGLKGDSPEVIRERIDRRMGDLRRVGRKLKDALDPEGAWERQMMEFAFDYPSSRARRGFKDQQLHRGSKKKPIFEELSFIKAA